MNSLTRKIAACPPQDVFLQVTAALPPLGWDGGEIKGRAQAQASRNELVQGAQIQYLVPLGVVGLLTSGG